MTKPGFVNYPHFQTFSENAQQRQPGKCESARALEPIRAERSSNGSCEDDSALQLRHKSWSELQRSKPTRGNISEVKRLQKRHLYIGRGASHLGCGRSFWANPFQVKRYGLQGAISKFETLLHSSPSMQSQLVQLTDKVLLCHCSPTEPCHWDVLIRAWEKRFLNAEGQDSEDEAAQAEELFRAAELRQTVEEPESQSEEEPGQAPRGAGWRGRGPPMSVGRGPTEREFHDGAGLCSPGRWQIDQRVLPDTPLLQEFQGLLKSFAAKFMGSEVFAKLACGKGVTCPFGQERESVYVLFERAGEDPRKKCTDRPFSLEFRLLYAFLSQARGPGKNLPDFADGVRVGMGIKMPRVPAVYPRKRKWRLKEQQEAEVHHWFDPVWGADNQNYSSAAELAEAVEEQLELSVQKRQAFRLTEDEAPKKYGRKLVIASLGAQVKSGTKEAGDLTIRLLFDGTHGVPINKGIRVRDQDRGPAAPDIKRVLIQQASQSGPKFGFKLDVKDAHRLIPIKPCDWHLLACRSEKSKNVYVNTSGTFGVASAAYWWRRVATAAVRGAHYILGHELASWLLLVADDLAVLMTHGRIRETVLLLLTYLRVMGFPLSWRKLAGGESLQWVGYELLLKNSSLWASASHELNGWRAGTLGCSGTGRRRCKSFKKVWEGRRSSVEHWTTTASSLRLCTLLRLDTHRRA